MPAAGHHRWFVRTGEVDAVSRGGSGPASSSPGGLPGAGGVALTWIGLALLGALVCGPRHGRQGPVRGRVLAWSHERPLEMVLTGVWWFLVGWLLWAAAATITAMAAPPWLATSGAVWILCLGAAAALRAARHRHRRRRRAKDEAAAPDVPVESAPDCARDAGSPAAPSAGRLWVRTFTVAVLGTAVLAAPAWYGWRSLQRTPFDVPAVQTHGYKVLLFAALERADPVILTEPGREFCRPHYPHLFPLLVWAGWNWTASPGDASPGPLAAVGGNQGRADASAGVTLIPRGHQAHGSLAVLVTVMLLAAGAAWLSGSWAMGLLLAGLWAWSRPVQGMAGMFYAEPLLLLTTTFALLCWARAGKAMLAPGDPHRSHERLSIAEKWLWQGGVALAAGMLIKNEGVLWWLAAVAGMVVGWLVARGGRRAGAIAEPAGLRPGRAAWRLAVPVIVPGLLAWAAWTGWRLWHGLGESDFSREAMRERGWDGSRDALLAALEMVLRWSFHESAPFGGLWVLAVVLAALLCVAGKAANAAANRHATLVMAGCAGFAVCAVVAIVAVFPLSTLPSIESHLIAVWRLMMAPSIAVLLAAASALGLLFHPARRELPAPVPEPAGALRDRGAPASTVSDLAPQ